MRKIGIFGAGWVGLVTGGSFAELGHDVVAAKASGRIAIFFGFQNCSPIEEDLGLVQIFHELGVRFMQLTYNNQSVLGGGCYEAEDSGLTRFGRCLANPCRCVFVDRSRNRSRRYCCDLCADRANQAAARRRRRRQAEDPPVR